MSVCAVMLVKDEVDIIRFTVEHLLGQVDHIIIQDNASHDGTNAHVYDLAAKHQGLITVHEDPELGYFQDRKTTALAREAFDRGFSWVLPCDADEYWYAPDGRPIREWLMGVAPDVQIVTADLYNHLPTAVDVAAHDEPNPFLRMGWRQREHGTLPKVCCRTRPDLRIHMGNHGASVDGVALTIGGLVIRHYSWRSTDQYVRKIRNGEAAYAATDMHPSVGQHWRMWASHSDEEVADHFRQWFWALNPAADDSLIYDPAPFAERSTMAETPEERVARLRATREELLASGEVDPELGTDHLDEQIAEAEGTSLLGDGSPRD